MQSRTTWPGRAVDFRAGARDAPAVLIELRRAIHADPELGFHEVRTTRLVRDALSGLGLVELPCPTPTGAIFELDTGRPGRSVVYRADIDALPIEEETGLAFRSATPGVMHACGHDGHAAMLVGAARAQCGRADDLVGRHVFLFQPAEELLGGARAMVEGGVIATLRGDVLVSVHLSATNPSGVVLARHGIAMSAADRIHLELEGAGGHASGSTPGDVIAATIELAAALPTLAAGQAFLGAPCACNPGLLHAGSAVNVAPRRARIEASLRTFLPAQREDALARLDELVRSLAERTGVSIALGRPLFVPAVVNDEDATATVLAAAAELGMATAEPAPFAPSDDVSELLAHVPGCHFFLGAAPPGRGPVRHHAADFDFDEAMLEPGARLLAAAGARLARTPPGPG